MERDRLIILAGGELSHQLSTAAAALKSFAVDSSYVSFFHLGCCRRKSERSNEEGTVRA